MGRFLFWGSREKKISEDALEELGGTVDCVRFSFSFRLSYIYFLFFFNNVKQNGTLFWEMF